jgi:hypothetical protein
MQSFASFFSEHHGQCPPATIKYITIESYKELTMTTQLAVGRKELKLKLEKRGEKANKEAKLPQKLSKTWERGEVEVVCT